MLLFFVLMVFLLSCGAASLLLFPSARMMLRVSAQWLLQRCSASVARPWQDGVLLVQQLASRTGSGSDALLSFLRRRILLMLAALVLVSVPVLLALILGGASLLDAAYSEDRPSNEQVLALLQGEQLALPVAPPPLAFTTADVVQIRPLLDSANRNWQLLDPGFSRRLLQVFRVMREQHGYQMAILEGYRSPERQNLLALAGSGVTSARAFQSYHQFGLAADCAFLRDGKLLISEKDPWAMRGYRLYGEVAEAAGLRWGGRWTMMDFGHVELQQSGRLRE